MRSANFVMKLSEKGYERRSEHGLAGMSGPRQAEQYGVGALCGSVSGAYRTFRTVS